MIFAVVVIYNGERWIQKCFNSLVSSSLPVRIIAIDNDSIDRSVDIIKSEFPQVDLIEMKRNVGFGRANNIGIIKALNANADYVFLLNQDAWIEKNTIQILCEQAKENYNYGILSPVHMNGSNTGLDVNFSRYQNPENCADFYSDLYINKIKQIYQTKFVNAAAWLISRECLLKVGLFESLFFMYGEDENFIQRVYYHGFKVGIVPATKICHDRKNRRSTNNFRYIKKQIRKINLVTLLNINNGLYKVIIGFLKFNIFNLIKTSFTFRLNYFFIFLMEFIYSVCIFFKIIKIRKSSKEYAGILN